MSTENENEVKEVPEIDPVTLDNKKAAVKKPAVKKAAVKNKILPGADPEGRNCGRMIHG